MTWYLLYAKSGTEFEGVEDIQELGISILHPRRMYKKRTGRTRRDVQFFDAPYLPNFIVADVPPELFLQVMQIKHLAKTAHIIPDREVTGHRDKNGVWIEGIVDFVAAAEKEYQTMERIKESNETLSEFDPGQAVSLLSENFKSMALKFRRIVERADSPFPIAELTGEMMGKEIVVEADPLDVIAANW